LMAVVKNSSYIMQGVNFGDQGCGNHKGGQHFL
jgi:hypothetical protein